MEQSTDRKDWSIADYEEYLEKLHAALKDSKEHKEKNLQRIHDLQRTVTLKETMEVDYASEISTVSAVNEELRTELSTQKLTLKTVQRSLADAQHEIDELKETNKPPLPQVAVEPPKEPALEVKGVSWEDWDEVQDEMRALTKTLEESLLKVQALESKIDCLQGENTRLQKNVTDVTSEYDNAKTAYVEVFEMLQEHKVALTAAQEDVALLGAQPTAIGQRGNSLFAEVEDNRKELSRRYAQLQNKYINLGQQFRRNASNPSTFAAERASLQRMVESILEFRADRSTAELNILKKRIRDQDDLIQQMTAEQRAPVKVLDKVGVAEMRYIDEVVAESKERERGTTARLHQLGRAHLLVQQELIDARAALAAARERLVRRAAADRIDEIDRLADTSTRETGPSVTCPQATQTEADVTSVSEPPPFKRAPAREPPTDVASNNVAAQNLAACQPRVKGLAEDDPQHTPSPPTIGVSAGSPWLAQSPQPRGSSAEKRPSMSVDADANGGSEPAALLGIGFDRVEAEVPSSSDVRSAKAAREVRFAELPAPARPDNCDAVRDNGQAKRPSYKSVHIPSTKRAKLNGSLMKPMEAGDGASN